MYDLLKKSPFVIFVLVQLFIGQTLFAQTVNIKFIETTDEHGNVVAYDYVNERETKSGLSRVKTYLNQERANLDQEVILLSGGDILQGTPIVYYYNFEKTDGNHLYADVMNFMEYDAGAVGNHDIETGHEVYDKFNKELNFPWLAANAINTKSGEPYFEPYTIIEKKGVKIAILGLITPGIPKWLPPNIWSGIEFEDMIKTAKKWIPITMEKENPDLMVGLFHSGVDFTYAGENKNTPRNENASKLVAEQVPGFDLVFVGHDHSGWNETVTNVDGKTVYLMGASSKAFDAAVVDYTFIFDKNKNGWDKTVSTSIVKMADFEEDKSFLEKYKSELANIEEYVSRPIGEFTKSISSSESMFGPSSMVDLINNIQLEVSGADISFSAPLAYNASINADKVFVKEMFKLYRYENLLYTIELSGQEIFDYLNFSVDNWFNQMESEDDHLISFKTDEKGEILRSSRYNSPITKTNYYNYDAAAGLIYEVDVRKPVQKKIKIISMSDGSSFELTKKYKVAMSSYRGNGGGGHLVDGAKIPHSELENRLISSTDKDLRYYIMKWIEDKKVVDPKKNDNWKIIPEEWQIKGKVKDYKIMYR